MSTSPEYEQWRLLVAAHEAGHAITHLLVGHHVLDASISVEPDQLARGVFAATGSTTYASTHGSAVAELTGVGAGEVATRRWLLAAGTEPRTAAVEARTSAEHDREHTNVLAEVTGLPASLGRRLAAQLLSEHWDAVSRVAHALAHQGELDAAEFRAICHLEEELTWEALAERARATFPTGPDHTAVVEHLDGRGLRRETERRICIDALYRHGLLVPGRRRDEEAQILEHGLPALLDRLAHLEPALQLDSAA